MLLWHNLGSKNLGVQALTYSQLDLLDEISHELGVEISIAFCGNHNSNELSKYKSLKILGYETFEISLKVLFKKILVLDRLLLKKFSKYDYVIDIGEGDSFSDIYGRSRFLQHVVLKSLAIKNSRLILAPQTIGPFKNRLFRYIAANLMRRCKKIFVRDSESTVYVQRSKLNSTLVTDVAFRLEYEKKSKNGKIGVNISGLLWFLRENSNTNITLACDYQALITKTVTELLSKGHDVELICHVVSNEKLDDDYSASCELVNKVGVPLEIIRSNNPTFLKSHISQYDYFIGARMHACIAAVSANVPTIPLAYSKKFDTLFSSIHYKKVIDLRALNIDEVRTEILRRVSLKDSDPFDAVHNEVSKKLLLYKNELAKFCYEKS